MQDFRKKIVRPVAFCAILLCLLMAASAVMSALARTNTDLVQNRNKSMVELENEPADTIDVLVIGDSESYTTVSPMEIWDKEGIPSYVGGQTGQKIQESYYMLKKHSKPRTQSCRDRDKYDIPIAERSAWYQRDSGTDDALLFPCIPSS